MRIAGLVALIALLHGPVWADQPATAPARSWGPAKGGLQLAMGLPENIRQGGDLRIRAFVRNGGAAPVSLGPAKGAGAGLLIIVGKDSAARRYFTERVFAAAAVARWPVALGAGEQIEPATVNFADIRVYPRRSGLKLKTYYMYGQGRLPEPEGKLRDVLRPGPCTLRYLLCLPRKDDTPVDLKSAVAAVTLAPDLKTLSPAKRKAFVDDLISRFNKDAFAAMAAHGLAVQAGRDITPDIMKAVKDPGTKWFARMWLATTLADLRDPRAVPTMIELLDHHQEGVRHVVAYHGPKMRDKKLDEAIVARASTRKDPRLTALALLGYLVFRGKAPEKLLAVGLDSPNPRARSAVANALSGHASPPAVSRLTALLADKDQRVRSSAASALGAMKKACRRRVVAAMIDALDMPGDPALTSICRALSDITGRDMPYDPQASAPERRRTLAAWKAWWEKARKDRK